MKNRICALLLALSLTFTLSAPALAAAPSPGEEMRGVWVSSVYNLDYPTKPTTDAATLQKQADSVLDNAQRLGLNTVFLQVRPSADALYPSDIFPWSKYLTGTVGTAPSGGFDPLRYWIDGAHARGLELHAWLNPYRVTKGKDAEYKALPASAPAKKNPSYVVKYSDGNYYFDPGQPEVRQLVKDGVTEILTKYPDVDGIHLDDYFYPGTDFNDNATFAKYGTGFASVDDWRRENVNILVRELDSLIQAKGDYAFGISPSGVWANKSDNPRGSDTKGYSSYSRVYADTLAWIDEGTVDYICPQLYWYIGQSAADYSVLVKWWSEQVKGTDIKLYIGEAAYKVDDAEQGAAWKGPGEIIKHLNLIKTQPEVDGHIFFRYGSFVDVAGLGDAVKGFYDANTSAGSTTTPATPSDSGDFARQTAQTAGFISTLMLFVETILR